MARPKAPVAVPPMCLEPTAVRLLPVKPLVMRTETTPLAQQINVLQVPAPMVPASTIIDEPEGRKLAQPAPALSVLSSAGSVASRDQASSQHALCMLRLTQQHRGHRLLLIIIKMEVMNFSASIPAHAKLEQMLFMLLVAIPGPPAQFLVVILAKDWCTPAQYNELVATQQKEAAASKGKVKAMPSDNESNYGEEALEQEPTLEEGKTPRERMQQIAWNKCIVKKKANIAAAHAACQGTSI
ncbi:hypothetical protein C0993_002508 [Termitomyces sp. T159_Od127]|nr:hypothetical protein C0993_002508 [Termitomyces sp. T159_Od127]